MFLAVALILLVLWVFCFVAFHVTAGLIHILIVLAIIAAVVHFVRRPSRPV